MTTGHLRVYLGAAPGVGKTFRMLEEGHRRLARGTDVVIGYVEPHDRAHTQALVAGFEVVPRAHLFHRGVELTEMDVDGVLRRRPEVVLVDELAHTNVPGSRHAKRWQDVQELVDAGITVITTVNIQHLASLNDVVHRITGVTQRETVPDSVVRAADQIELVDMAPEALRRRMAHGNVYQADRVDAALGNYFRLGNLTALRELALLWVADKVDDQLDRYRADHHIDVTWEAREKVVVALTGGSEGDSLVRRAARITARTKGADLLAVHVARNDGLADSSPADLARQRLLVESLGGTYHQVVGADVPRALLDFARGVNATQLVLGASRRGRWAQLLRPGITVATTAGSGTIDVHLVTHDDGTRPPRAARRGSSAVSPVRKVTGFAMSLLGLPLLTVLLDLLRPELSLPSDILIFLVAVVAIALVGGLSVALLAAVEAFLLLNYFFTPPMHQFTIEQRDNLLALLAFLVVATAVSVVVDLAARRTVEASQARAEAETLSTLAGSVLRGSRPLPALLDQVGETFQLSGVSLLERLPTAEAAPLWRVVAAVGDRPAIDPGDGDAVVQVGGPGDEGLALVLTGRPLPAADRRVVEAFAAQAAVALRQERLTERAAAVEPLAEVDRMRTALLSAVSHDLRSPLASARAAVGGLRSREVSLTSEAHDELLATADESLERLSGLVENLLDMSRLQAGVLAMSPQPTSVADVLPGAVDELAGPGRTVQVQLNDETPDVVADPALLQRVLVNLLANALRYSPGDRPPIVAVSDHAGAVEIRVIDFGPGVPSTEWDRIFMPFQRLGDRDNSTGVGLGLALSRGLVEAMGGMLTPEHTPGGGLTMTVSLPAAEPVPATYEGER